MSAPTSSGGGENTGSIDQARVDRKRDLRNVAYGAGVAIAATGLYDMMRNSLPSDWGNVPVLAGIVTAELVLFLGYWIAQLRG